MPLIPARFRRPDPEAAKRDALRKDVAALATTMKAMQGIGAGTSGASVGAMGPVMPGSQFQGGWNNLGNASMAMLQRVTANMARQHQVPVAEIEAQLIEAGMTWGPPFPPGRPLDPFFGYRRPPRTEDYTVGENVQLTPRWNRVSFATLKGLYDAYDVAQICVAHCINDVRSLDYEWVALPGERDDVSGDIEEARAFFEYPDRRQPFRNWLAEWMQDVLRYDAGTLYIRRTNAGKPYALEPVTGTSMIPLIDFYGRIAADSDDDNPPVEGIWPGGDTPGFLQIIEGMPWTWHTVDDIIYLPLWPLPESQYGQSPLERILLSANTDIRFQQHFLDYFTSGTLPAGFMEAPQDLSDPALVAELQETWDALMLGDQEMLRRIRFVPFGSKFTAVKNSDFDEQFPLYLMRRVAAAYGITPANLGFTETVNRATSDTQVDIQWRVGTLPHVRYVEDVINLFVRQHLGLRCRLQFDKGQEIEDRLMSAQADQIRIESGVLSPDEARAELGQPIDRSRPIPRFIMTRNGPVPLLTIESMSGKIDEETYAPDKSQALIPNPYMGAPGVLPVMGSPEAKAAAAAAAQMQRKLLQATTGQGPTPEMQAAIAAANPSPAGTSSGPEGTTARPAETPPMEGAGSRPEPSQAAQTASKEGLGGGGNLSGVFSATSGIQGDPLASGSGDDDDDEDDDETSELYGYNEEWKAAKSLDALIDLRRWRENARNRIRKGQSPRQFRSTSIPPDVQAYIWGRLEKAGSRREVNAIFADVVAGRPFGVGRTSRAPGSGRRASKASAGTVSAGSGMVSLDIAPGTLPTLDDGVSDQHITIVFIGKGVSDDLFDQVCERAQQVASSMAPPSGTIGGLGQFPPSESSDWMVPVFAIPDVPAAEILRAHFEDFNASEHTDYHPHVTLGYFEDGEQLPDPVPETPVSFSHLSVHRGDDVRRFPFKGASKAVGEKADEDDFDGVMAGGLIVQAQDTGRVLMIQRLPDKHDDDAAYARWEWPGGCLDVDDQGVWQGALREWEEETGSALDEDAQHVGSFLSQQGNYQAYVIQVPSEDDLDFDPQPEEVADIGWWDPADLNDGRVRDKVSENLEPLRRFLMAPAAKAATTGPPPNLADASPEGLAMVPPHHCANCCLANNPNCVKYGDWPVRPNQVCDGWEYSARVAKATAADAHRHTDRIVEHYQTLIAQAFEDLFPQNALREAIEQARAAGPVAKYSDDEPRDDRGRWTGGGGSDGGGGSTTGVAKAAPSELVAAAVAALRARLRPPSRLTRVLHSLYGDAALQAAHAASEQLGTTMGAAYTSLTRELPADYWSDWTPGWGDAASQAASGGLRQLLDDAGVQIKSIVDTRLDDLGNVIASGIAAGDGVDKIARDAQGLLTDPSRAFLIADTETARAMTAQTMWDYQQAGVGQVEWLAQDDACELCLENEAASPINLGDEWPNGAPPTHPRCRCALTAAVNTGEGT